MLAALPKAPSKYNPYRNIELAKFRRNLVLKNLYDNKFLDFEKYTNLKNQNINLKKKKKIFLEDAQYYIEDVRKKTIDMFSYNKVYDQGLNINTPINLNLQKIATKSLRDGLISYDKRKGWRGALENKTYSNKWSEGLEKYFLENSIGWEIAIVKEVNQFSSDIETINNDKGIIEYRDITWTKKILTRY